jgi:cell division protein FtsQ
MTIKKNIRRIILGTLWCAVAAGLLVLLGAAMKSKTNQVCKGLEIDINGAAEGQWFIDKKDIVELLSAHGNIKGAHLHEFNLKKLESLLEKQVWIRNAELFFDNNNVLQVLINEREPIARIFTSQGNSFYIDSSCEKLPLSEKMSARLPVFTNFPSNLDRKTAKDSVLLCQIKNISSYILKDPFWMAQVAQIDISIKREFELVPMIGSHTIEFGNADEYESKFKRLMTFYKQVLSKTGLEKYSTIKLQYRGQVVAVNKEANANRADSSKAVAYVQSMYAMQNVPPASVDTAISVSTQNSVAAKADRKKSTEKSSIAKQKSEKPVKETVRHSYRKTNPYETKPVPKAVMPKRP